jgi:hypothetical protein
LSVAYVIQADSNLYTVVDDLTTIYWAVITGSVTDEILGKFIAADFSVQIPRTDLKSKATESGLYAITGYPEVSFPKLSTTSYPVTFVLRASGFRDFPVSLTLPAGTLLPFSAPDAALRRLPVRIQGRVVKDATGAPQAGKLVVGVDDPTPPPPPVPHTTLLRSPLYFSHAKNTTIQEVTLTTVGSAKLTQPASSGDTVVYLTNTTGLAGSAFVQFTTPSQTLVEYATVDHLGTTPGQVFLKNPLNRGYAAGLATNVNFLTAALGAQQGKLQLDADPGDGILVADTLLNAATIVVDPGSPTSLEYHEVGAITDNDGYYFLDGMGRVQELFLRADPAVPGTPIVPWFIQYEQPVNVVNFRL